MVLLYRYTNTRGDYENEDNGDLDGYLYGASVRIV